MTFVCVCHQNLYAQIFIEQGKVTLNIKPGERVSDEITVHNTLNEQMRVNAYWEDFEYQPPYEGAKKFYPAGSTKDSFKEWVQFSPQEFVLPAFGKMKIQYVFNVPSDVQGGYYGVLFFEKIDQDLKDPQTGVNIVTRVGCLFFLESEQKSKNVSAENFSFSLNRLNYDLKNEGDVILIPKAIYYVMDQEGNVFDRGEFSNYYIPPQGIAQAALQLGSNIPDGQFTLVLTLDLQEGDSWVKEIDFEKNGESSFNLIRVRD